MFKHLMPKSITGSAVGLITGTMTFLTLMALPIVATSPLAFLGAGFCSLVAGAASKGFTDEIICKPDRGLFGRITTTGFALAGLAAGVAFGPALAASIGAAGIVGTGLATLGIMAAGVATGLGVAKYPIPILAGTAAALFGAPLIAPALGVAAGSTGALITAAATALIGVGAGIGVVKLGSTLASSIRNIFSSRKPLSENQKTENSAVITQNIEVQKGKAVEKEAAAAAEQLINEPIAENQKALSDALKSSDLNLGTKPKEPNTQDTSSSDDSKQWSEKIKKESKENPDKQTSL